MILSQFIGAFLQVAVVLIVCAALWAVFGRKTASFRQWLGLTIPPRSAVMGSVVICLLWFIMKAGLYLWPEWTAGASADNTVAGMIRAQGMGPQAVFLILIIAFLKTALAEEILFRGLIAKRLIAGFGFKVGNWMQALLFGAVHLAVFAVPGGPEFSYALAAAFLLLPAAGGWLMGYVNERMGNGSIVPGWILHGLGNALSYPILAFWV